VVSTGGAYPAVSLNTTNPAGIGRISSNRFHEKLHSAQSRLTIKSPLEWIGVASFVRCVLQQDDSLQQPFWHPESLALE
jgi:hypothetical protein